MSHDRKTAHARARKVVGESVWDKLSENAQANAINDEMRIIDAENTASADPVTIPSPGH
jgi:hypothetical protein